MTLYIENMFFVECSPGTYGYNCSKSCGHCLGTSECDPIDGRCINGCEPGWQPTPQCDIGRRYFIIAVLYPSFINVLYCISLEIVRL